MVVAIWVDLAVYGPAGFPQGLLRVAAGAVSLESPGSGVAIRLAGLPLLNYTVIPILPKTV